LLVVVVVVGTPLKGEADEAEAVKRVRTVKGPGAGEAAEICSESNLILFH